MQIPILLLVLLLLSGWAYFLGRKRSLSLVDGRARELHSLPTYYGYYTALWCGIPALLLLVFWIGLDDNIVTHLVIRDLPESMRSLAPEQLNLIINDIRNQVHGNIISSQSQNNSDLQAAVEHYRSLERISGAALAVVFLSVATAGLFYARHRISAAYRARNQVEKAVIALLVLCSSVAIVTTLGVILSVLFESVRFFQSISLIEFFFGTQWSPQTAIRTDQVGSSGAFGAVPLFVGTTLISLIALLVAVPVGLMSAIYLSEYADARMRAVVKPVLEILAGIPTVVYGFFAALTVGPLIRGWGEAFGLDVASESALAAGLVMGVMIIPFVSSLSDDVINAVPQALRDGAYALGATKSETVSGVVLPAALPGVVASILLAASRAIGETMIVVMAAGLAANMTFNPLDTVSTVTVQIVTLLVGDQEFDSPKTLAAFALGLSLFVVTLILNVIALHIVRKYREQYE